MATAKSAPGQLCQLTAVAPSWSSTGIAGAGRANRVAVYVQVLAETHVIVETIMVGEFTYSSTGQRGQLIDGD